MIVLDASVVIALLDSNDQHHVRAVERLAAHADEEFAMSVLTIAEVLVAPTRANRTQDAVAALARLGVQPIAIEIEDGERLAHLRDRTKLRMPDCCVLLAAQRANARIVTFDDQLERIAQELLPS